MAASDWGPHWRPRYRAAQFEHEERGSGLREALADVARGTEEDRVKAQPLWLAERGTTRVRFRPASPAKLMLKGV